tara:strand:- start:11662 stop:12609 length:948 start_codon:yes stop_codon:yes gene_type:complete
MPSYKYKGINSIDEQSFYDHVMFLKQNFDIIGLEDLPHLKPNNNYCLITFDDGLKCCFDKVYPIIKTYDFPVAFFICTKPLLENKAVTIHKSQYIRSFLNPKLISEKVEVVLKKNYNQSIDDFSKNIVRKHYRYDTLEISKQKYVLNYVFNKNERNSLVQELFKQLVKDEKIFVKNWYLTKEEIKEMNDNFFCIGSHCHSHNPLAQLKSDEVYDELKKSKKALEDVTEKKISVLSYPLGNIKAVKPKNAIMAESLNYKFAFTMERQINRSMQDPLLLARIDCNDLPVVGKKPIFSFGDEIKKIDGSISKRSNYRV